MSHKVTLCWIRLTPIFGTRRPTWPFNIMIRSSRNSCLPVDSSIKGWGSEVLARVSALCRPLIPNAIRVQQIPKRALQDLPPMLQHAAVQKGTFIDLFISKGKCIQQALKLCIPCTIVLIGEIYAGPFIDDRRFRSRVWLGDNLSFRKSSPQGFEYKHEISCVWYVSLSTGLSNAP